MAEELASRDMGEATGLLSGPKSFLEFWERKPLTFWENLLIQTHKSIGLVVRVEG